MTQLNQTPEVGQSFSADAPESWAPRDAPLDMPRQDLTPRLGRVDLGAVFRLILPGRRA